MRLGGTVLAPQARAAAPRSPLFGLLGRNAAEREQKILCRACGALILWVQRTQGFRTWARLFRSSGAASQKPRAAVGAPTALASSTLGLFTARRCKLGADLLKS